MRKTTATILLATAMAGCSSPKKINPPVPLVEIPFASDKSAASPSSEIRGQKHCFISHYSGPLYDAGRMVEEISTVPSKGLFQNGDTVFRFSKTAFLAVKPALAMAFEERVEWKINKIDDDSIELRIAVKGRVNRDRTESANNKKLTPDEKEEVSVAEMVLAHSSSFSVVLDDSVKITKKEDPESSEELFTDDDNFKSHLREIGITSFCFQTTSRNSVYVEIM